MGITIKDVAKLAGTSVSAVSVALNAKQNSTIRLSAATRDRIYSAAAQLGYVSNPIAKSLATGKTKVLGLMLPYADAFIDQNPFCNQVLTGIMQEVVHSHYNLMLYTATSGIPLDKAAMFIDSRVEGVLFVMPPENSSAIVKCQKLGIPYVSILQRPSESSWTVNSDDYMGGRLAGDHLLKLGHTKIVHLKGNPDVVTSAPRLSGFQDALISAGVELPDASIIPAGFDWRVGYEAMTKVLEGPRITWPTAIFAANDLCAEGAIRAIRATGLSVPEDIAVVGYDDTWFSTMTQPPLTTVHMPIYEMGELAARMLISRLEGQIPDDIHPVLPVSLTVRHSCGGSALTGTQTSPISIQ